MKTFWISMGKCIPEYLHEVTKGLVKEGRVHEVSYVIYA